MKELIEIGVTVTFGAIVLFAFVVILRRLARDNEPVEPTEVGRVLDTPQPGSRWLRAVGRADEITDAQLSWHEQERLRKKHSEQERARKKRQKNRKGGRS